MRFNAVLLFALLLSYYSYSQTLTRHSVSMNFGAGTNFFAQDEDDYSKPISFSLYMIYEYKLKENFNIGFMYGVNMKGFNKDKLYDKLDNDTTNFGPICIQSSQRYISTAMLAPTFRISKLIFEKTRVYFIASSGLLIISKSGLEATYHPFDTTIYSEKYFAVGGNKTSFSPFVFGSVGVSFPLVEGINFNLYYAMDYFHANIFGVYSEKIDNNEMEQTFYQDKFNVLEHSIGAGFTFTIKKWESDTTGYENQYELR